MYKETDSYWNGQSLHHCQVPAMLGTITIPFHCLCEWKMANLAPLKDSIIVSHQTKLPFDLVTKLLSIYTNWVQSLSVTVGPEAVTHVCLNMEAIKMVLCVCVFRRAQARRQPQVAFLGHCPPSLWRQGLSLAKELGWLASKLQGSAFPALGSQVCTTVPCILYVVWELILRCSCSTARNLPTEPFPRPQDARLLLRWSKYLGFSIQIQWDVTWEMQC